MLDMQTQTETKHLPDIWIQPTVRCINCNYELPWFFKAIEVMREHRAKIHNDARFFVEVIDPNLRQQA